MTGPCGSGAGSSEEGRARTAASSANLVAMSAEQRAIVRAAMSELAEDQRAVLRLVHEDGLRLAAAAAVMGLSSDAVRMLYGRAIAALAERMSRGG